ncbi:MAG TPA: DUF327 family protein [Spirochaetota bacterium]|nr:DUF327 family protein [Spirochaetota bacterium]
MIELPSTSSKKDEKTKIKSRKKGPASDVKKSSFSASLKNTIEFDIQGSIEELLHDLEAQERRFIDMQTLFELQRYRAIVQKILKTVFDETFRIKVLKRPKPGRADYVIVQRINDKLEALAAMVANSSGFTILKSIEEIRGLVLDLVH